MPSGYLALVIELHHPLPGPGLGVGMDWARAAVETYWPVLRALTNLADMGLAEAATLAVSPSWTALAADPSAQALARAELDRRADRARQAGGDEDWSEHWHELRQFVVDRWESDPLGPLRRAHESGAVEVIPTASSHAWLPSVADAQVVARAQVAPASAELAGVLGAPPQGFWLPGLAYRPDLEQILAESGLRYFGVDAEAFRRGTVRPPADVFGPLVTPPGTAAFGVDPGPTENLTDTRRHYSRDPRYSAPGGGQAAVADHVHHFLDTWRERVRHAPVGPAISVASVSAHDLGGGWTLGATWLEQLLCRMAETGEWTATTPGRFLDRFPEGPVGRPGPSAGGWPSVRPAGSDLLDRCRAAADVLAEAVEHRDRLDGLGRRALAQMTRLLLTAQAVDWHLPPGEGLGSGRGLERADRCLAGFARLAGLLAGGRLDGATLAAYEAGPAYLPEIDLDQLDGRRT